MGTWSDEEAAAFDAVTAGNARHRFGVLAVNPILIDTNAYTALKRGHPEAVAHFRRVSGLQVGSTLAELSMP